MNRAPPIHPCAEELAQFLIGAFGEAAGTVLEGLQLANGNEPFMRFLEAYGYVWEPTSDADAGVMREREGMRRLALMIGAAPSITQDDLKTLMESTDDRSRRSSSTYDRWKRNYDAGDGAAADRR